MSLSRTPLFLFAVFIASCGNNEINNANSTADNMQINAPTQNVAATATNFLKWYAQNYAALSKLNLVNHISSPQSELSKSDYAINFEEATHYLNILKSSGFVSDKYISSQMDYFKKCDQYFKSNPQQDGPAVGFEADLILMTQEIDETLAACATPKITEQHVNENKATITLDVMMHLRFNLSKANGKWLIDSIETVFTP